VRSFFWSIALAVVPVCLAAKADAADPSVFGEWATRGYGSRVRLEPCLPAESDPTLCGTIVWLWEPNDEAGKPRTDSENPERSKRMRPLVGTRILSGFSADGHGVWRGGEVYNPEDGRSYSDTIRLRADGLLELEGCALAIFCQKQVWRRPRDVCADASPR
jgi:uncharacterized protein (DUF2147 family)